MARRTATALNEASMKRTVKYSKGEIGRIRLVEDFLPSPDRRVLRAERSLTCNVYDISLTGDALP